MWSSSKQVVNNEIIKKPIRRNIIMNIDLATTPATSFTYNFDNINFIPDELIVKSLIFRDIASNGTYVITSDLTDWQPLAYFSDNSVELLEINLIYPLGREIKGTYTFNISAADSAHENTDGYLAIFLEFIKY